MKLIFRFGLVLWMILAGSAASASGDFGWMRDFNMRAETDPMNFRERLEARFGIGELEISDVLKHVEDPADGYMLLRLGEMAHQPIEQVIEHYDAHKGKGWGVLAKSLGIKPGSKEFHDLKQHQDLYDENGGGKSKGKDKGKGKKPKS
jgi:hypothetical protein